MYAEMDAGQAAPQRKLPLTFNIKAGIAQGLFYALVSLVVLNVLGQVDRAPQHRLSDPIAFLFLFGAMIGLRLITKRLHVEGWPGVILPAFFPAVLPFTFMQRTALHEFGEWFLFALMAYLILKQWRGMFVALVGLACLITPVALCMPLIALPILSRQMGRNRALRFAAAATIAGWLATIATTSLAWGHGSMLFSFNDVLMVACRAGSLFIDHSPDDFARLWKLIPQGTNLVNMLVLTLLAERFVLGASRQYVQSLGLAFGVCVVMSLLARQQPGHLLALMIAPAFICLVDGLRRVPSHLHRAPGIPAQLAMPAVGPAALTAPSVGRALGQVG